MFIYVQLKQTDCYRRYIFLCVNDVALS